MEIRDLISKAFEGKEKAYTPYSNFNVGAAVLAEDNKIYKGCNIEIASYGPTLCGERTAIFKAISEGNRKIKAIAIVGDEDFTYPCGVCRQVMREFGQDLRIIIAKSLDEYKIYSLADLLPHSFGPENLKIKDEKHV